MLEISRTAWGQLMSQVSAMEGNSIDWSLSTWGVKRSCRREVSTLILMQSFMMERDSSAIRSVRISEIPFQGANLGKYTNGCGNACLVIPEGWGRAADGGAWLKGTECGLWGETQVFKLGWSKLPRDPLGWTNFHFKTGSAPLWRLSRWDRGLLASGSVAWV